MSRINNNLFHLFFLFIIITHYSLSFIIFDGHIFSQETDIFDAELLFNKILGEIYSKDFYTLRSLLNGNYEWIYFTRAFFLINFLYSYLSTENAFLVIDIFCKFIAYISFFKLSKLLNNNSFLSFLIGAIYAYAATTSFTDYHSSLFGFGSSILPYLVYLALKKKKLTVKNYLIISFSALNSHFYFALFFFLIPIILYFFDKNINKIKLFKIFSIFFIFCIIVNSNLFYLAFFSEITFNREFWSNESVNLFKNFGFFFEALFYNPFYFASIEMQNDITKKILYLPVFFKKIPLSIIYTFTLFLLIFKKIKRANFFILVIFFILFICFLEKTAFYKNLLDYIDLGIMSTIQISRIKLILTFIFLFALSHIKVECLKKYFFFVIIFALGLFQINYMILPVIKNYTNYSNLDTIEKKILKEDLLSLKFSKLKILLKKNSQFYNDKEFLTIDNYYDQENFLYIKNIVKDEYVLPININPAKLIFNKIKTIGGYFQFYPMTYKKEFRKIFTKELENNSIKKSYFDNYGHRLYIFVNNYQKIELDFDQIKLMNVKYIISDTKLSDVNIKLVCENCNGEKKINLYSIR